MSDKKTIWITGSKGFLGSEFVKRFSDLGYNVIGTDYEVTVCDADKVCSFAVEVQPDVIINCAGIPRSVTGLSNRIKAYETNALGARNVALAANTVGALIIQVSTDDVFPPRLHEAVNEFDNPHPECAYGKSKRAGETMVRDTTPDHAIIRSSWLYSVNGGILMDILNAVNAGKTYKARTDQFASPTSVSMYVKFLDRLIQNGGTGVFHITSQGCVSRYDFAAKVMEICGIDKGKFLEPATDLVTAEKIELESLMLEMYGAQLPAWDVDLRSYLEEVGLAK
ncbi:MAG: SDR family oxidoreductase [Coriobacteriia bacterium]|nr:SDR family oxidoreductase [Coriobacteriia bacterium]